MGKRNKVKIKWRGSWKEEVKNHKTVFVVYVVLRLLIIGVAVASFISGNYQNVLLCALSLVLFMLPTFVSKNFGINFPETLEIIILLFIFAAEILGEISAFYQKVPFWDSMLHTVTGFLAAAIGFALVDVLNRNTRFKFMLSPVYMAVVAFCFSMTVGTLWEFFEFFMDQVFNLDMQKDFAISTIASTSLSDKYANEVVTIRNIVSTSVTDASGNVYNLADYGVVGYLDVGIIDTMKDLFVNFVGAVAFSIIGFFYVKSRGKGEFAKQFIPTISLDDAGGVPDSLTEAPADAEVGKVPALTDTTDAPSKASPEQNKE